MSTDTKDLGLPADLEADTQAVLDSLTTGKTLDVATAQRLRERGDHIREEIQRQHGTLDIGVPAIRELRGELPNP